MSQNPLRLSRVRTLIGDETTDKLTQMRVLLLGIGGVGSYAFEALVRSGIGHITAVDRDCFEESNLNRQLYATVETIGRPKAEVAAERAKAITDECEVIPVVEFVTPENAAQLIENARPDIILDAIDNVSAKIAVAEYAYSNKIKSVMCLGTGNRLDPSKLRITDINETSGCPLARVMRRELKKRGIHKQDVVFSDEVPVDVGQRTPASMVFVPAAAGMLMASRTVAMLRK